MPLGHRALFNRLQKRLRFLRRQKGLTQEQVALLAGITSQYLDALENGREKNPSLKVLAGLCKALKVELGELFIEG